MYTIHKSFYDKRSVKNKKDVYDTYSRVIEINTHQDSHFLNDFKINSKFFMNFRPDSA